MKKFCLIGSNISYSLSKKVHELIYELYNIDASYEIRDVSSQGDVKIADYDGFNITIPFKNSIKDSLSTMSSIAKTTGSVNVVMKTNRGFVGHNTDYFGFVEMLEYYNIDIFDKDIVILGDGATSKTVLLACQNLRAKSISFVTRKDDNNYSYNSEIKGDVLINTTPIKDSNLISLESIKSFTHVIDLSYRPYRTTLLATASNMGIKVYNGLYMLIAQAVSANRIWFDKEIDTKIVYKEYKRRYLNLAIIGYMGSGKTTLSKVLGNTLNKEVVDLDEYIEEVNNNKIYDIFANEGEASFRELEHQAVVSVSTPSGRIIATGGGVVLKEENMKALKENAFVVGLKRCLDQTFESIKSSDRPLAQNKEEFINRYNTRDELYHRYSDMLVNSDELDIALHEIINKWEEL